MSKRPYNITQFTGINNTDDPFLLGKQNAAMSAAGYNFRSENGIKVARRGYEFVAGQTDLKHSGVYFPYGAKAILPLTLEKSSLADSYLCCGTTDFTIEFWYKMRYLPEDRFICRAQRYRFDCEDGNVNKTQHMRVTAYPVADSQKTGLRMNFIAGTGGTYYFADYEYEDGVPTDGDWHHVSIKRDSSGIDIQVDAGASEAMTTDTSTLATSEPVVDADSLFSSDNELPLFGNHMEIGGSEISIAEFRVWTTYRDDSTTAGDYDVQLAGTETDLVCYVPFDEANGKHFTERVYDVRGYFHPQEPYVNDDNELVFTGFECAALPSLRAKFETDDTYFTHLKVTDATTLSEDGAYHGGFLWDRGLRDGVGDPEYVDSGDDINNSYVWRGVAQIRLRLRQLKEGVICGRLGIKYNTTLECYNLFFADTTNDVVYTAEDTSDWVDESWIGAEKTITVFWNGNAPAGDRCKMYVDAAEVAVTYTGDVNWSNGTHLTTGATPVMTDSEARLTEAIKGGLGGNTEELAFCMAFDVIFFRQWWDNYVYTDKDEFVAATYNLATLPDSYRYIYKGLTGKLSGDEVQSIEFDEVTEWLSSPYERRGFLTIPITTSLQDGVYNFTLTSTGKYLKSDTLVRRVLEWTDATSEAVIVQNSADSYNLNEDYNHLYLPANGCVITPLVNEYNFETFRDRAKSRLVYSESEDDDGNGTVLIQWQNKTAKLFGVIEDDSPAQGTEYVGTYYPVTRYLVLCNGDREMSLYGQRSAKPRWCTGPLSYEDSFPMVRSIFRYRSEDGSIDKLFAHAGTSIYEMDPDLGTLTTRDWGWLSGTSITNAVQVNNRLLLMSEDSEGVKINYKDKFSRIGVERPTDITVAEAQAIYGTENLELDGQYGYSLQYYDSENGAASGTIPIFARNGQTVRFKVGDSSSAGPDCVWLNLNSCREPNIDGFRVFRTKNLSTAGIYEKDLFLVADGRTTDNYSEATVADRYSDSDLDDHPFLPTVYYGQDMVPKPCPAITSAFNRVFIGGNEDNDALIYFSNVDSLGFARVDEYPETQALVVEEGGTSAVTALLEYNGSLLVFKDNAVFQAVLDQAGQFTQQLIYKGVGALNQRCALIAGGNVIFMDTNGIYALQQGEPVMISAALLEFFKNDVNTSAMSNSFMLYDKEGGNILCFVPSSNSTYCDLCVVYNMRTQGFTLDIVPPCACGFADVDNNRIYIGTTAGAILQYSTRSDAWVDQVASSLTGSCSIDSAGDISGASGLPTTGRLEGALVFAVDTTDKKVFRAAITENTATTASVDSWTPVFNADGESPNGTYTYYIGYIFVYDKTADLMFDAGEEPYDAELDEVEYLANDFGNAEFFYRKTTCDSGVRTDVGSVVSTGVKGQSKVWSGRHRHFNVEACAIIDGSFKIRNTAYFIEKSRGRLNG